MATAPTAIAREFHALASAENRPVTPLELIKLTYLAHGWSLGLHGQALSNESPEAWQYGPVFPELYHALKRYRANPVDSVPPAGAELFGPAHLSEEDKKIIRSVYNSYKRFNGVQLSAMTHQPGTPWDIAWRTRQGSQIPDEVIREHFSTLAEQRNVRQAAG